MYKIIILQTPGKNKKQTLLSIFLMQVSPLQSSPSIINQNMLHFKNNNYKRLLCKNVLNRGESLEVATVTSQYNVKMTHYSDLVQVAVP